MRLGVCSSSSPQKPSEPQEGSDSLLLPCVGTAPQRNSSDYVRKLLAANGVVMGKTRMHELAYGVTSINPVFGPVLNPYDVTKIPGGEST